ncbi:dmX-like protein 1 isoform X1 [Falco naumanni]|uniref:dmX-like protein 1 isoform X1 n=2 Tax=Falco naumanni TaxID=148594 RepID=UPI001ADDFD96|nr:dmX-like protein 1 isoform X1 [Falco naumanni]
MCHHLLRRPRNERRPSGGGRRPDCALVAMNLHQVLTGAVNPGDNCFSVGNLHDQPFTAYASGCDIVVLGTDFERLQIIPGAKHGNIQVGCVDCSMQQGKIAASYGKVISIFEPVSLLKQNSSHSHCNTLHYQWQKNAQILLETIAHNLTWDPTGTRLLTGSSCLQLWSNVPLENPSDDDNTERTDVGLGEWSCIWQCKTASQICLMKFSPDGEFFATAGKDDCLVKVWYNTDSWRSAVTPPGTSPENEAKIDFSFVYLAHPRSVNSFSWRKTSKFMPRGAVCNVLLTCCKDNVCRLWAETLLPNDSLLYGGGYNNWSGSVNFTNNFKRNTSSKEKVQNALELNLRHFRRGRRRSGAVVAHTGYAPHQQDPHEVHRNIPPHANALCHFHIAASINPATDIPLLPSITSLSLGDNEEKSGPFVVHWLNNKELHFTLSMEVFLQQLQKSFEHHSPETNTEESNQMDGRSEEEVDENGDEQKGSQEKKESGDEKTTPNSSLVPLSSAIIDHEIEVLLSEWSKNADMLFSIHPMDGSLLVWHVDWLDEYQPGMFRQVQVSFVSRIPVAFPTGDANSLCRSIVMYACTKNVDLAIQQGKQKPPGLTRSSSMLISSGHSKSTNSLKLSIFTPNVMMISKHADGSLNQWLVSFAEESAFSTVLSISHKSRYCGHRFHLNDLACHSVLPLLLTTSHHNALISPDVENAEQANDSLKSHESPVRLQSRSNANVTSQDPNVVYSELILWRVDPVGPLSFSGGVSELARINSLHVSAFSNVAWLPTLIPSYCLGAYCNSPSACFVASDGLHLRLYQAVIDAKKLLCELSNPEISKYVGEVFNIISQQSTARPGCIIELDAITELHGRKTQLLHVFQEEFILNHQEKEVPEKKNNLSDCGNQQNGFSEKFYLIVIEYTQNHSLLHMWHLHLKSIPVSVDEKIDSNPPEAATQTEKLHSSPDPEKIQSPFTQKYQACRANLQSTSWLSLSSKMVYSQELNLPEGVEIISVKPSAGHLSSSSIYPVCRAPYLLATSCSDGKVRFWRCRVTTESSASSMPEYNAHSDVTYVWEEWPLLIEDGLLSSSAINVPGRPTEVSCAHTNRLAVAYKQVTSKNSSLSQEFIMHVSIFECESTGGSSWILEQTLHLDEIGTTLDSGVSIDSNLMAYNQQDVSLSHGGNVMPNAKHLVRLDWMSREDGSHILTVGIGSKLYMFGQVSGKVQEQSDKEILAVSHSGSMKATTLSGFVLLRCVDLVSSVEGSPPFPVSLSWVRDGILVVGMDCEMHVYSQWQSSKQELVSTDCGSMPCITSLMKQSQSAASALHPPKRTLTRSMTSLAQKLSGKRSACDLSLEMEDSGLFEAAHTLSPTLPQYHPYQLLELMDLGKVRRAKAILSHLVKCIAGEVVAVNESEPNHDKRLRSLTISASGSTARDPKTFSKTETTDYIEIDSVPPLPLHALLAADDDLSHSCSEKPNNQNSQSKKDTPNENYEDLFQNTVISTDELVTFDADEDSSKPKVIDLSQYSPTYFGPEHAQVLSCHLLHSSLPGLTRMEQMSLMALADTIATTSTDIGESRDRNQGGETLDECGLKFLLAVRLHTFLTTSLPPVHRAQLLHQGLSTSHFAWAFHSVAEEELLSMLPAVQKGDPSWSELRAMGIGWWVRNIHSLRKCIEKVAKAAFQRNNDPLDAAIFYLAMKKKAVIWGLYRSQKDTKMTQFFGNNFTEDRWRKAALKNAFSLLGKQRFEHSAAFFLLAGHLKDAVEVCLEKLNDIQLALVISRLYESEFEVSSTYKSILQKRILGNVFLGKDCSGNMHCDPFLRSMAYWILEDYSKALDTLIKHSVEDEGDERSGSSSCNPAVFNFYNYLRTHPLLLRRHFGSSDTSSTHICLTVENGLADKINLGERRLFFTTAYAHLKAGCPMLALEVLSKMPKVVKRSKSFCRSPSLMDTSKDFSPSSPVKELETKDQSSSVDWSQPVLNSLGSSSDGSSGKHSSSTISFDWSQPSMVFQDEHLKLQSDSDDSDESEDSSLVMKELKPLKKTEKLYETSSSYTESCSVVDDKDILSPSEDIISAQLKFRACLKILTVELRTLSTGYEVDGGKLRYQLYQWLEREVVALQKTCDYSVEVEEMQSGVNVMSEEATLHENTEDFADQQKNMLQKDDFQKRRQWLLKYQSLLRMFLSYCILHGSHGGGLASVRMELILLLQESQQEQAIQIPSSPSPLPEQSSIPLLFACTASAKTVVANPLLHLGNLTHDILHAIINLDSPPHPDTQNNKIYVMHTLAASLSACIYQCLCDGHSYSLLQANQFTGTVYQTVLLTQRHSLRTTSLEETATPNTSPAQWPGITALIRLLNSAGEEAQPGLTVLLCEILTAVYLSLFIHGLATHSSNELYRIMAHPLNNKMWSAIFGGGAHTPSRGQLQLKTKTDDGEKQQKRYRLSPKTSPKESSALPALPLVDQESPSYKERFIPPELSIWDYFIAKPFLPPQSRVEYDSEESQESGEDDENIDRDVFASNSHNQEHSNSNSYSWSLMRLAMVQLVLHNLKIFYPLAGHDLSELPVSSPICHAVLKTLQRWEQVLLRRLQLYGGPPQHYISVLASEDALAAGPALLRHKTLLEPTNTPFKSNSHVALSVKRLWQYLVKQEEVQETFIRNIFTKKQCLNESLEEHNETMKNSVVEEPIINKIETDRGYPGGKARIIHKESDIITAFAVNKANRNCIAIASSHDIQELDVSAILATQIYTWVDDDVEIENKGADDFLVIHARDDLVNVQGTTPYTHSNPGTPINMPWLGSTQTGRGASVEYSNKFNGIRKELARKEMLKKAINNVRRMASHPTLPYYLTGAQDGSVRMFEWGHAQQITCFRSGGNSRVTRMRFNYQGNKFGIVDADGYISLYQTNWKCCPLTGTSPKPYLTWQCHNRTANDFVFISSSSLIATAGLSSDNRNICLWDTLVSPTNSLVHAFICHDSGATVLAYAPKHQLLISGGRKGFTCIIDLRQKQQQQLLQSHDSPVKAIAVDPTEEYFVTGSAEGNIKVWSLSTFNLLHTFINEHARQSLFRNIGTGVMQIETGPANHIFSCGADGTVKMRILPDRFSPLNDVLKNDVKFMI